MSSSDARPVLDERLVIDPTAFVAPGASVVGRVTLGPRSSVWFSAVIRADMDEALLGEESNLQDGAVIHVDQGFPTRIGPRVTVGHRAILHGAVVEEGSLIGMGAILLNGARIGRGSLVAAGALVREGQVIPERSLVVGAPARVAGPVTDEHRVRIERGVHHYVELAHAYRARGYAAAFPAGSAGLVQAPLRVGDELAWTRAMEQLEITPARLAQDLEGLDADLLAKRPAPERWSIVEVLCHLRDVEREVYAPRLTGLLEVRPGELPLLAGEADMDARNARWAGERHYRDEPAAQALAAFVSARGGMLARLERLTPADWSRTGIHPSRGAITLFEQVRRFATHDLSHLRQIELVRHDLGA